MTVATFQPVGDTYIDKFDANANFGTQPFHVGKLGLGGSKSSLTRGLMAFDLAALAGLYASLDSAELFFHWGVTEPIQTAAKIVRCRRAFTELGATWNKWNGTDAWTTAGAVDTTNDIDIVTPPIVAFNVPNPPADQTITGMLGFVQDAVDLRSGFVRIRVAMDNIDDDGLKNGGDASSREAPSQQFRPLLTITYTPLIAPQPPDLGRRSDRARILGRGSRPARPARAAGAAQPARPTRPGGPRLAARTGLLV